MNRYTKSMTRRAFWNILMGLLRKKTKYIGVDSIDDKMYIIYCYRIGVKPAKTTKIIVLEG